MACQRVTYQPPNGLTRQLIILLLIVIALCGLAYMVSD